MTNRDERLLKNLESFILDESVGYSEKLNAEDKIKNILFKNRNNTKIQIDYSKKINKLEKESFNMFMVIIILTFVACVPLLLLVLDMNYYSHR